MMLQIDQIIMAIYEVLDLIAIGGQAEVAKTRNRDTGVVVAIKHLIARPNDSGYAKAVARFKREATEIEISHPGIISPLHYEEDNGEHFIV